MKSNKNDKNTTMFDLGFNDYRPWFGSKNTNAS